MHILNILPSYPPESFIKEHLIAFSNENKDINISIGYLNNFNIGISESYNDFFYKEIGFFSKSSFSIFHRVLKKFFKLNVDQYMNKYNERLLRKIKPDLIHFQFGWSLFVFSDILANISIPYCVSFRGSDVFVEPTFNELYLSKVKIAVKKAKAIHVVSETLRDRVIQLFQPDCDVQVIHSMISIQSNIASDEIRMDVIAIGRLHWVKDFQELILGFNEFLKIKNEKIILKIVGTGPEYYKLKFLVNSLGISDYVIFLGFLPKKDIIKELLRSKLFVLTSHSEGMPNVLLEALSCGVNSIAPDHIGLNYVFNDFEIDYYKKFDFHDLANVMVRVYDDNLSLNSTKIFKSQINLQNNFNIDKYTSNFLDFYNEIIKI